MTNYGMELLVRERIRERMQEAERERLVRAVAPGSRRGRPWRARVALAVARRLTRVAEAS